MSPTNEQVVGPFAPAVTAIGSHVFDKLEHLQKAIYRLEEEVERQQNALNRYEYNRDKRHWQELRPRLIENKKELEELRAMAASEQKKREQHKKAIFKLEDEAERLEFALNRDRWHCEYKERWESAWSRFRKIEKDVKCLRALAAPEASKLEEEKAAAEKKRAAAEEAAEEERKRAAENAATEQKRRQELLNQKEEEKKALQAQLSAEKKRKADAEAAAQKYKAELEVAEKKRSAEKAAEEKKRKAELAAAEEKGKHGRMQKIEQDVQFLKAHLAEKKKHADLLASQKLKDETNRKLMEAYMAEKRKREEAVEEARQKLADAERRLWLEDEERRNKSYEVWKAQERERQRAVEEAARSAAQKEKEASDARKEAERRASSAQKSKEVSFDPSRDKTYDHRPASRDYHRPEEHNAPRTDKYNPQKYHQASHDHSRPQNPQHSSHLQKDPHRQDYQSRHQLPAQPDSQYHPDITHPPAFSAPTHVRQAAVGLSGLRAGSSIASYSPAVAPWEEKDRGLNGYAAIHEPSQKPSITEKKWSTPVIPTWVAPVLESKTMDEKHFSLPGPIAQVESPKEKWPLPPLPTPSPRKIDVCAPRETEEEKLRRELDEYKAKCVKLAADLERKKRVSGADSVATWQTGTRSIWEDPTKNTPKSDSKDAPESSEDTRNNSSKPAVSVQNLRRRQPSASYPHHLSKSHTEAPRHESTVNPDGDRPNSRTSTHTRYFEAEEYVSADEEHTPRGKSSKFATHSNWQKASIESTPRYVPPTPHRHPSPPPNLPPTPPRGSKVSTPVTLRPAPKENTSSSKDIQTPKLTGIPGSWREEPLPANPSWPTNVSTPSIQSPVLPAGKAKETYKPDRYIPPYSAPKDVAPPGSYLFADARLKKPSYNYPVPPYYPSHATTAPQPGPALYAPVASCSHLYASDARKFPSEVDVEAGPSRHGGQYSPWADPTAAQSLGGIQAPPRKDKGKGRAR
ncbi:hypothetical protein GE21DRAFT_4684 [Neurospora crassa]|uniref:Uncharacterized protein n=1 Tax=Neurospora crassa (strain ATCC 24698 / 74-OR23-1A / CBS 708.71 / DSM 1257 / FGSC 987) TaxID=367110 RepID=Q7RYU1_NEUCR|nr:hypothetical protein NCU00367 [Neurospora crassa OR74A]EAA28017.1 hypothetical protein NCU00367 [Neurospora crassa OR74A]KHE87836.1 hypothetical protein GE21DRAFT_4684 [Neurospora crassa]|eukprot:XP_957253.1 hypothetical protein NCU00367 [Neurospora crassa OR74A]